MVQIIARKLIKTATPSGNSVPFCTLQTCEDGKNLGVGPESGLGIPPVLPVTEVGIMTITMNNPIMLNVEP